MLLLLQPAGAQSLRNARVKILRPDGVSLRQDKLPVTGKAAGRTSFSKTQAFILDSSRRQYWYIWFWLSRHVQCAVNSALQCSRSFLNLCVCRGHSAMASDEMSSS